MEVLSNAEPKRNARMMGRTGSWAIQQRVVKCRGREIDGVERAYLLVSFFLFFFFL